VGLTHATCRLTAKNRDQLRNPTIAIEYGLPVPFLFYHHLCLHRHYPGEHERVDSPSVFFFRLFQKVNFEGKWLSWVQERKVLTQLKEITSSYQLTTVHIYKFITDAFRLLSSKQLGILFQNTRKLYSCIYFTKNTELHNTRNKQSKTYT